MEMLRFLVRRGMPALALFSLVVILAAPPARETTTLWTGAELASLAFLSCGGTLWIVLAALLHCFSNKERPRHVAH